MADLQRGGISVKPTNPIPISDMSLGTDRESVSSETVTFVGKAAASSRGINALDKRPILNLTGDKVGSYWGKNQNRVWKTDGTQDNQGVVTSLTESAGSADVAIKTTAFNLENFFEDTTAARYVIRVYDNTGATLHGWIGGVAVSSDVYTFSIFNATGIGTQNWVGTLGDFDNANVARAEIYSYETSFVWGTGTVLTKEVNYDAELALKKGDIDILKGLNADGDYAIDYEGGRIFYRRATTGSSDTATYSVPAGSVANISTVTSSDNIAEVGAVAVSAKNAAAAEVPLLTGYEYEALGSLTTDGGSVGDKVPLKGTATGILYTQLSDGTSTPVIQAAMDETEDEAGEALQTSAIIYGYDSEGSANSRLRAVQVGLDNAGLSATPNVLVSGGIFKSALDTYGDNDAVPLHFDSSGRLLVEIGTSTNNAAFDETEDEAADSEFMTCGIYGFDSEGSTNAKLRSLQVAVDNTALSATPNVLVAGGIHKTTLDTYGDNDASPNHYSVNGQLLVDNGSKVSSPSNLLVGAFELGSSFADVGSEIDMNGFNQLGLFFTIDIGTSTNVEIRILHKHESAGAEEYREINLGSLSDTLTSINLNDYQVNTDADQLFKINIPVSLTTPYVQIQAKDAANGDGQIDAVKVVKAYAS